MTVMNRNTASAAQVVTESTSLRQRYQALLAGQDAGSGS